MKEGKRRREGILRGGRVHMEWLWRRSQGRGNGCGVLLCDDFPSICYIFLRIQTLDCESMFIESKMMVNPRHESPVRSLIASRMSPSTSTKILSTPVNPSSPADLPQHRERKKKKRPPLYTSNDRNLVITIPTLQGSPEALPGRRQRWSFRQRPCCSSSSRPGADSGFGSNCAIGRLTQRNILR